MAKYLRRKSYYVLPALSVRRKELRKSLRTITTAVTFAFLWFSLVRGSHTVSFCNMLGFNDLAFGVMAAIPFSAALLQPITVIMIERTGLRKYQFILFGTIHRLMWIAVALAPLLMPLPSALAVWTMLLLIAGSSILAAFSNPAWWPWMGDMIPRRIRGRHIASRSRINKAVAMVAAICVGLLVDAVTRHGAPETAADQPLLLWTTAAILALGGVFGTIDILLYLRIREVLPAVPEDRNKRPAPTDPLRPRGGLSGKGLLALRSAATFVKARFFQPLEDRAFRYFAAFAMTVYFAMASSQWFLMRNAMENLRFSKLGTNVLILVLGPLCAILTAKGWGRLIDRWGRRPVLILATAGAALAMAPMFLASPLTPNPQFLVGGINWLAEQAGELTGRAGVSWVSNTTPIGAYLIMAGAFMLYGTSIGAVMMVQAAIQFGFSDGRDSSKFVAVSFVFIGMGGVLGGLVGGAVAQGLSFLQESPIVIGPLLWNNWHAVFLLAMIAYIFGVFWVIFMPDPGSGSARGMVRMLGGHLYNSLMLRHFYPRRPLRRRETSARDDRSGDNS